jgi:hypothetical protein
MASISPSAAAPFGVQSGSAVPHHISELAAEIATIVERNGDKKCLPQSFHTPQKAVNVSLNTQYDLNTEKQPTWNDMENTRSSSMESELQR